jgi:hypothetical protein
MESQRGVWPLLHASPQSDSPIQITLHKAAVVGDGRTVPAVGALIEMPAQGGSATARDGPQHFEVLPGDPPAASFDECVSSCVNQIRHFEWRPVHLFALR